jgi:hypothetical protein
MLQINPFLDCTVYSRIIVHIGRNSQTKKKIQNQTPEMVFVSRYNIIS